MHGNTVNQYLNLRSSPLAVRVQTVHTHSIHSFLHSICTHSLDAYCYYYYYYHFVVGCLFCIISLHIYYYYFDFIELKCARSRLCWQWPLRKHCLLTRTTRHFTFIPYLYRFLSRVVSAQFISSSIFFSLFVHYLRPANKR